MQKLIENSQRTLVTRQIANRDYAGASYSQARPQLIPLPANAHLQLAHAAEAIATSALPQMATSRPTTSATALEGSIPEGASGASATGQETFKLLPDIGKERCVGAVSLPTPFIPVSPRIAADQVYNFDHGALSAGLVEETSYMVWF